MGVYVELFRDAKESQGRDRFSCPAGLWELLREVGETFGWQPQGTTYLVPPKLKITAPARQNYQAGSALDYKRVEAEDALGWARALDGAKLTPAFVAMVTARSATFGAPLTEVALLSLINEFIQYLYGGGFTFAIMTQAE